MIKKFSQINESKKFMVDPAIIKKYASFIIPLYITGELTCPKNLLDEYLEMNKSSQAFKTSNVVCDLEIMAIKNIHSSPITEQGFNQLKTDIRNKCIKLERFLRKYIQRPNDFQLNTK